MFNTLYLLNYNNYYNRLVKSEETLEGYLDYAVATLSATNFNPNDGISAQHICNIEDNVSPDYAVLTDLDGNIVSRWFVIESERVRGSQYRLSLYRDTIVDYYNIIIQAPCFIEKGIVPNSDSAIFNSENMTLNRIKTSEMQIKDNTNISWIVAYLARDKAMDGTTIANKAINGEVVPSDLANIVSAQTREEWLNNTKPITSDFNNFNFNFNFYNKVGYNPVTYLQINLNKQNKLSNTYATFNKNEQTNRIASAAASWTGEQFNATYKDTYAEIMNYIPTASGLIETDGFDYNQLNNLTISFEGERNKIYRIQVAKNNKTFKTPATGDISSKDLMFTKVQGLWSDVVALNAIKVGRFYGYSFNYTEYSVTLVDEGDAATLAYNIPQSRVSLQDAPYDMICAPYEDILININGTNVQSTTKQVLAVFNDIATKYAGENAIVYDIQRLPYCPIAGLETVGNVLETAKYDGAEQMFPITTTIDETVTPVSAIFACSKSNFYKYIPLQDPIVVNNAKMQSMCDVYRLCSPNYNGAFEFDVAMNGGLYGFNVYCTYKPFNPYIQVAPTFGRMYGKDFKDARGLICGGEWSMPIVTSAWATYERQNANYLNTFQRQIENMKVTHKVQKEQEVWSAIAGTLQAGVSGASIAGLMGGGPSAMLGAGLTGGVLSGLAGIRDIQLNNTLRNEALNYSQDLFGYQLGNIQALPMTLSRVSAFTINNKIFPFLEYYTCTNEEKIALANKIAYNGMTIMRIGTLSDYVDNIWSYDTITARNYVKGKIIRLDDLDHDTHLANTIAKEINQGLYFGG